MKSLKYIILSLVLCLPAFAQEPTLANSTDIGGLQSQINGKEPTIGNGTLTLNKLAQGGATANQTLTFNGTQWVPGNATASSGNVTNAQVNSAISANATATRSIMEVLQNNSHLLGLQNLITQSGESGDFPASVIVIGDSFSATGELGSFGRSNRVVGSYRTGQANAGGDSGVTKAGVDFPRDYTLSPEGFYYKIASGGNLTCAHLQTGAEGPVTHVYYTLFPGTGTAQMQYSDPAVAAGAWQSVGSAINTTGITTVTVGETSLGGYRTNARCRVVASGGEVQGWIGQGSDGPGVTITRFDGFGQGVEQCADITEARWKAIINGYKKSGGGQLVLSAFADHRYTTVSTAAWPTVGTEIWSAGGPMQTLYDWSRAQNPTVDWLIVSPHQVNPAATDTDPAAVDAIFSGRGFGTTANERIIDGSAAQREFAVRNGCGFVDVIPLFPNFTLANAEGFYGDDIHLTLKGQNFKRAHIWQNSGMEWVFGNGSYGGALRIGNTMLSGVASRGMGVPAISARSISGTSMLPFLASAFNMTLSGNEDQGLGFRNSSANVMRFYGWGPGGYSDLLEYSTSTMRPITDATGQIGDTGKIFQKGYFGAIHTGYTTATGNYSVGQADHMIHCTSGNFTVTLPKVFSAAGGFANKGRELVIVNSGNGTITLAPAVEGTSQKIDAATSLNLAAGEKVRIMSTGTLSPSDYSNWITLP